MCLEVYRHVCACRGQRLKAIVFINLSLPYILRGGISYSHLELTNLPNLASQISCLYLGNAKIRGGHCACLAFSQVLGSQTSIFIPV